MRICAIIRFAELIAVMLFIMLVDTISQDVVRSELPWELLYADDLAITDITSTDIQKQTAVMTDSNRRYTRP